MSAWIVDKAHIDAMLAVAVFGPRGKGRGEWRLNYREEIDPIKWVPVTTDNADALGLMLWSENFASIHRRYPDTLDGGQYPGPLGIQPEHVLTYAFPVGTPRMTAVEILKAVNCYVYQSCEHEGWEASRAKRFCEALTDLLINYIPGYDAAPWGITVNHLSTAAEEQYR